MPGPSAQRGRWGKLRDLTLRDWRDLVRAGWELWKANRYCRRTTIAKIYRDRKTEWHRASDPETDAITERVSVAVPRAARYVFFRSDCLIQARAAQTWLARENIGSEIRIGADGGGKADLEAHAWLLVGDRVVTGGEIARFTQFD